MTDHGLFRNKCAERLINFSAVAIAACGLLFADESNSDDLKVSTGLNYFYGDYGRDDKTEILHSSLNIKYRAFPWVAKLALPILKIDGFGGIDGNGNIIGDGTDERRVDSGIGDVVAQLAYQYVPPIASSVILVNGKVKFPTADENKGLGTGEYDYSLETQVVKSFDRLTPFMTFGYTYVGKSSDSILKNRFYTNLGSVYRVNPKYDIGLMYAYKQASSDESTNDRKIIGFFSWKVPQTQWSIEGYLLGGLTDASPDAGGGVSLSYLYK